MWMEGSRGKRNLLRTDRLEKRIFLNVRVASVTAEFIEKGEELSQLT